MENDWLIIYCIMSRSRIFHLQYVDVTIDIVADNLTFLAML
jgi:hypothetical protein